ncbi:DUF4240 domain-containing protein [Actinoplanes solisilvae]|uniref:DUF4240 domain-containing protein n=1 Tax=Actinoplanes solisilvae TaxID=2486853 RepID=UPI000FDB2192|nr:DUF4240 domain-containing protein [Actinoplanes solisilvae]
MTVDRFWALVEQGRAGVHDPSDAEAVADRTRQALTALPAAEVAELNQALHDLMADSYRVDLWGAAYQLNGGCSDDGFEYFRGWLLTQGRAVFERVVADPDALADLPAVRDAAGTTLDLECEDMFGVVADAYHALTGTYELPRTEGRYPELGRFWDFDDDDEFRRRLPRLSILLED